MDTIVITSAQNEENPTRDMVIQILGLSKLQIRRIFTDVLQTDYPENVVLPRQTVFYLFVADLLENLTFLNADQRFFVIRELRKSLPDHEFSQVVFFDNAYVTWTGRDDFISLETGDVVEALPRPAIEAIGYNLSELYERGMIKIRNRSGANVKNTNAGSVAESGDICDSAVDAIS